MSDLKPCPLCHCEYTYQDSDQWICPECAHEWVPGEESLDDIKVFEDAHGNVLQDGDTVMLTQNLKVKGTSSTIKTGTKVKNIRLVDGDHDIDCKVDGIGPMKLKTQFVKKV